MEQKPSRDPATREAFARRLRALRRAHGAAVGVPGMPQSTFARLLGFEDERYRRWERGEMEPPLDALIALRRVTGISLCLLIGGDRPGNPDLIPSNGIGDAGAVVLGDRVRIVRECRLQDAATMAVVMGDSVETWLSWESGAVQPPVAKMEEFAHRTGASLDFLYRGLLVGLADDLLVELERRYPGMWRHTGAPASDRGAHKSMDMAHGRSSRRSLRRSA